MPKLPNPQIRPWSQHTCNRSTTAQASTPALASTAVTSATGTTLVNSGATWTTNQYQNFWVTILTGTGSGQTRNITSNTATTLTVPTWTVTPDNTSTFQIAQPLYPGLQGSLAPGVPGGSVLVNVTYREVVPTAGAAEVTARLKTTTAAGTLTLTPIRLLAVNPDDPSITDGLGNVDTTKVQKYSTGGSSATVVVAGTELALTVNPAGEAYCLLEFACTTAGTLNYCDVMTLQAPGNITTSGGGGGTTAVTVANGADTALGSTTDAAQIDYTQTATLIALTKGISEVLQGTGAGAVVPVKQQDGSGNVQPAGDVAGRALFVQAQGEIADGSSSTGVSSVLVGGNDGSGLARTIPVILATSTPTLTAQYGAVTNSVLFGNSSANVGRALVTAAGFSPGGSAANTLTVAEIRAVTSTTYEQAYNNLIVTLLSSAARTTTQTSADQTNFNHTKLVVILDMTVVGTGSVTLTINGKDPASAKYYNLLTGAAVTTNVTNVYTLALGVTAVANTTVNAFIPRIFQIVVTANNANTATYSVGYSLVQ